MSRAVKPRWPSSATLALIKGGYAVLHRQLTGILKDEYWAARMIGRTFMGRADEAEDGSHEEPRR